MFPYAQAYAYTYARFNLFFKNPYIYHMKTADISVKKLKTNPSNPRNISEEAFQKLVQSIKDFPEMLQIRPIVIDKNFIILGGNMRFKAAVEAGLEIVPVIQVTNWTDKKKKEFIIKDNISGGEWDLEALLNEWDAADLEEWGLDVTDFETETELASFEVGKKKGWQLILTLKTKKDMQSWYDKLSKQGIEVQIKTKK